MTQPWVIQALADLGQTAQEQAAVYGTSATFISYDIIDTPPDLKPLPKKPNRLNMKDHFYNEKLSNVIGFTKQTGEIGLEIECEGRNLFYTPFTWWTTHDDHSLRAVDDHKPVEYVLKVPVSEADLHKALMYLARKLKDSQSEISESTRTSVHVHVNCQDMTIRELYCYICLYLIFEELLVDFSGPNRAGNLFCLRAKDSEFFIQMLESVLKNSNFKQWKEDYRYTACNVNSILKFGSLEFRSMRGCVDIEAIETWVSLLLCIKKASNKYESPIEIFEDFTSLGPLPFFKKTFKNNLAELYENVPRLSHKLWDGARLMRDVAYACKWDKGKKKEHQEEVKYRVGDAYTVLDKVCTVQAVQGNKWYVRDTFTSPGYNLQLIDDQVLYYVFEGDMGLAGAYLKVDVRPGPIEYCPGCGDIMPEDQEPYIPDDYDEDFDPIGDGE
jgi:hypothetical protein